MELISHIQSLQKKGDIIYIPNFGNAGDAIIALGTFSFFDKHNIKYKVDHALKNIKGNSVVFAGGGAFIGSYKRPEQTLEKALIESEHVTILPHTIKNIPNCLKNTNNKVTIFAREETTYRLLRKDLPSSECHKHNDMAFELEERINSRPLPINLAKILKCGFEGTLKQRLRAIKYIPNAIKHYRLLTSKKRTKNITKFNCFRNDIEKTNRPIPKNNSDISDLFKIGTETKSTIQLGAALFVNTIKAYSAIETDRLHCAITAALLGKEVFFHPNNYFKNLAVYKYSMKSKYPNVHWVEKNPI